MEAYSTATVRPTDKVDYWQSLCSRTYADLELSPRDHRSFEGELRRSSIGPFSFVRVSSSAARITRSPAHETHPSAQRFEIFLTLRGESVCVHNGRTVFLRPGDFTLVDLSLPYRFEFEDICTSVSIGMPKDLIAAHLPVPGLYLGRAISGQQGVSRLAAVMIDSLCDQVQLGQVNEIGPSLARGILDVLAAAYSSSVASSEYGSAAASTRRVQIRAFIEGHLRDPQLTPRYIAASLGISPRYLRLLFSQQDETIARYVTRRRIEEATRELADSTWRRTTITDIAYHWGFSDAAQFSRAFREQFGVSPRHYRQEQAAKLS